MRNKIIWFFTALCVLLAPVVIFADFSDIFTTATPTQSSDAKDIDDYIRQDTKRALQERLAIDHYFIGTDAVTSDSVGFHKKVSFIAESTDPDTYADVGILYQKLVGGTPSLYFRIDGAGTVIRLTDSAGLDSGNLVNVSGTQTITGSKTLSGTTTFSGVTTVDSTIQFNDTATFDSDTMPTLDAYAAPTTDAQFAPKKYVDDQITASDDIAVDTKIGTDDVTTNTSVYVDMTWDGDDTYTDTFTAGNLFVLFNAAIMQDAGDDDYVFIQILIDGVSKSITRFWSPEGSGEVDIPVAFSWAGAVTAGSHIVKVQWKGSGTGIITQYGTITERRLTIIRNLN